MTTPFSHNGLDHIAIVVPDTGEALKLWRDIFGFPLLYSEVVNGKTVRLTHLDMGSTHLQLVEPLAAGHPLRTWLEENGPGLHHFCMKVDNIDETIKTAPVPTAPVPHQGTRGKRAVFFDSNATGGVRIEVTGQ